MNSLLWQVAFTVSKKKNMLWISVHTLLPLAHSSNSISLMEWVHFVGQSQARLCGWAATQSQSLQVSDEPDAANGATPRVTASESWCFWSMASWKKQATTKNIMEPIRGLGEKMHIYNYLIVRLYIQFQESALSWQWLAEQCWKVTKLFMLLSFSIYKIT